MPPKKSKGKGAVGVSHRSVKHKETTLDYDYDPTADLNVDKKPNDEKKAADGETKKPEAEVDPVEYGVFQYYMSLVDQHINTRHVFQIFMLFFLANLTYLYFITEKEADEESKGIEKMITVLCILLATVLESFAVLNSKYRQYVKDRSRPRPQLLDFNYIYAIFFPLAIGLLKGPDRIVLIAACVVQVGYMNVFVRGLISYVVLFQFADMSTLNGKSLSLPVISCFFFEMLNKFVGDDIPIYEKAFLSNILTVGSFFINFTESNITLFVMKGLYLSFIVGMILSTPLLELYKRQTEKTLKYTWLFFIYLVFFASGLIISDKLLLPRLGQFHLNWVIDYIKNSPERIGMFKEWLMYSVVAIPAVFILFNKFSDKISLSMKRKVWHFLIFIFLIKQLIQEPELVSIALFGILGILIIVETVRCNELPPFGGLLKGLFVKFQDSKDTDGELVLSYIYLVMGISLPLWINNVNHLQESSYIGLITLGLGDAFASLIGSKFGRYHWPETNKTIEGSIAMVFGMLGGYYVLDTMFGVCGVEAHVLSWHNRVMSSVLCALFEGIVDVNDNLFLPVFGYLVEELLVVFN